MIFHCQSFFDIHLVNATVITINKVKLVNNCNYNIPLSLIIFSPIVNRISHNDYKLYC